MTQLAITGPKQGRLRVRPLSLNEANDMVESLHRHHKKVVGHRFSIGLFDEADVLRGVAIVGRPVSRGVDWRTTAEVTRLVTDGTPNACSALYGATARITKEMGFQRIQTYILASEPGTSLRASGWQQTHTTRGGSWDTPSRARVDKHPVEVKTCWVKEFNQK